MGDQRRSLSIKGQFTSSSRSKNLIVNFTQWTYLPENIARVVDGFMSRKSYMFRRKNVITLNIVKRAGEKFDQCL